MGKLEEIEAEAEKIATSLTSAFDMSRVEVSEFAARAMLLAHQRKAALPQPPPPWVAQRGVVGWIYEHPRGLTAVATLEPNGCQIVSVARADGRWASSSDVAAVRHAFFQGADAGTVETWRDRGRTGLRLTYLASQFAAVSAS